MLHVIRAVFVALLAAAALLAAPRALADAPAVKAGAIHLALDGQARGPLELLPHDAAYEGEFVIENVGAEPLFVSRVAPRGDVDDVRSPAHLGARFADGSGTSAVIAPHASKRVRVTWEPAKDGRARQLFGHIVVTSTDDTAGEVAMGVKAAVPRSFAAVSAHPLLWLIFLPFLGALAAIGLHFAGPRGAAADRATRWVALAVAGLECLLALWVFASFDGDMTRADGNDGFQFIDRVVWVRSLGVEFFVGLDGTNVVLVALAALLAFVGVIASFSVERAIQGYFALFFLLVGAAIGVFVALDLVLFFVFWETALLALAFLVAGWGGARRNYAALKVGLTMLLGTALLLIAVVALHDHSDRTFLVDGTAVSRGFAIPDLMRVAYNGKHLTLFGFDFVKVVWVALFLAFGLVLPMFPLHTWLPDAVGEAPAGTSVLIVGLVLKMGPYGILRVAFAVLPEASRWAAGTMVALGAVSVVWAALCALSQNDLRRLVAYGAASQMGFCLIGLGAMTPQGISGCILQMFNQGILGAMLVVVAGVVADRAHTQDIARLRGLGSEMPVYATFFGLAFLGALGLPGLAGFWGQVLAIFGAFPLYRGLACLAAFGGVLSAAAFLSAIQRVCMGKLDDEWRKSPYLEPFGGKFPEISFREIAALAPLAVLCVGLGLWPAPLFATIAGGVRDTTSLVNPPGPDQIALLSGAEGARGEDGDAPSPSSPAP